MSATGPRLARSGASTSCERSALAFLIHALNQPLTGLQCSMELALAVPRSADEYVQSLTEGLELLSRIRVLTEAVRELTDLQSSPTPSPSAVLLDKVLRETGLDLQPVAESRNVRLTMEVSAPLRARADLDALKIVVFRALDCGISLAAEGSNLRVEATHQQGDVILKISWRQGAPPTHSPFSRPEIGLLIAQAAGEHLGASCLQSQTDEMRSWTLRIPLAGDSLGLSRGSSSEDISNERRTIDSYPQPSRCRPDCKPQQRIS